MESARTIKSPSQIRQDFDRIAIAGGCTDEGSHPYDNLLLSLIPPTCRRLLDLGCGTGRLTRAMAQRATQVTAVDFPPEMVRQHFLWRYTLLWSNR